MHIFLTGRVQIGKSTVISRTLDLLHIDQLGGFRTVSVPTVIPRATHEVYIVPASGERKLDRYHLVGVRWGDRLHNAFPDAFEQGGVEIMTASRSDAGLLLMDELGVMESRAPRFCAAVLSALDNGIPILGVIKPKPAPLLDAVRAHPQVRVVEVTEANRDALPDALSILLTTPDHRH